MLYFPFLRLGPCVPSIDEISQIILGYRYEFRINLKTNEVTQKQLSLLAIECPKINEEYTGR
jgi:carotenoid cleavage dioxygenase-like enzyme